MRSRRGRKVATSLGKPPKRVLLHVSKDVVMSFCVAGVALCDIDVCEEESGAQPSWQKSCRFYEGKSQKTCLSRRVRRCAHVVLRGRRGTLCHSTCVRRNLCARPSWEKSCRFYEGKVTTTCLSRRVRRCGHVVLQGRRGTL